MPGLLNVESVMMCPHGGTVQAVTTNTRTQVGGAFAVLQSDTFLVAGCAFNIAGVPSPCLTVEWIVPATQSQVEGAFTLTEASVGLCLGPTSAPQGPVIIASTQPQVEGN